MWRIELASLLSCIGSEIRDEILVYIAEYIVSLPSIHRNVLDKMQKSADGFSTCARSVSQLRKACLQGFEDVIEHVLMIRVHQAAKSRKRISNIRNIEV